jgi:hypothetical protein
MLRHHPDVDLASMMGWGLFRDGLGVGDPTFSFPGNMHHPADSAAHLERNIREHSQL